MKKTNLRKQNLSIFLFIHLIRYLLNESSNIENYLGHVPIGIARQKDITTTVGIPKQKK